MPVSAIILMIVTFVIVWGGLIFALIHLKRGSQPVDIYTKNPDGTYSIPPENDQPRS